MKLTNKQLLDIMSYSLTNENGEQINVYYAIMTSRDIGTLLAYHMRKARKHMAAALEIFFEHRDEILKGYGVKVEGNTLVLMDDVGSGEKDVIAEVTAKIDELLTIEVDDIPPLRLSRLLEVEGTARSYLIEYDALSILEPLIEDDVQ